MEIIDQLYLTAKLLNLTLFHLHPLFYDKGSVSIWRYFDSIPSFFPFPVSRSMLSCYVFYFYLTTNKRIHSFWTKNPVVRPSPWLYIILFATAFSSIGLPGPVVQLACTEEGHGRREDWRVSGWCAVSSSRLLSPDQTVRWIAVFQPQGRPQCRVCLCMRGSGFD